MKHNFHNIVTFDQSVYLKAAETIIDAPQRSSLKNIVLMSDCVHTLMNFQGAIGFLMEGTGLKNILETIRENAVVHIITCKAAQKVLRVHFLVDKCLHRQLIAEMTQTDLEIYILIDQAEEL
ncbi:hypothetical protein DPMN_153465 [Dreissena polymorpha]|uniref:Uncharacterized protein n=1 Tax=Dreissena polymorpha TaxID=45954 RepID=A0A9D4FQ03_DREPO|nr:hypothetical protein DPMN_153465 [Dreissena polymorpha]